MWYRYSIASNCPQTRFVARADHVTQRRGLPAAPACAAHRAAGRQTAAQAGNPCGCPDFCNGDRRASGGSDAHKGRPYHDDNSKPVDLSKTKSLLTVTGARDVSVPSLNRPSGPAERVREWSRMT